MTQPTQSLEEMRAVALYDHLSTFDPPAVLALLDRLTQAEAALSAKDAEIVRLKAALRPFEGCLTAFPINLDDGDDEEVEVVVARRDLKRVEAALNHGGGDD